MKAYITKYALTAGIQEFEGDVDDHTATMFCALRQSNALPQNFHGREWHRTRELAVARANEMKAAKIKSLEEQLELLKRLKFT